MVAHVSTIALNGIQATTVDVQVQISSGLAAFHIVGLPDSAVKESRERVRGAFHAMGISLPAKRITVNLSPADIHKEGSHFDLPIAVGLLMALGILPEDTSQNTTFMGELGLDGSINAIQGALPSAIHAQGEGASNFFLPRANAHEAAWAGGLNVYGAGNLMDVLSHMKGENVVPAAKTFPLEGHVKTTLDFQDVRGQESAKRAAEIAAAGGHNFLMVGPPGAGKSMIASRMVGIMPPLSAEEMLEVSMIHSIHGSLGEQGILTQRPFRDPHHSASAVAMTGGGHKATPGEMSLAHRGLLFLDELPEFPRQVLETLRQPLETGTITVARANRHVTYPARFQLIAAMNPCPCGYLGHPRIACRDSERAVQNYLGKISGPLLDRIDLHVNVPVVDMADLTLEKSSAESSATIASRVARARTCQAKRFEGAPLFTNAEMGGKLLEETATPDTESRDILHKAAEKFALSARGYHRVLRVARTIADLAGEENIRRPHVVEALAYRHIPFQGKH